MDHRRFSVHQALGGGYGTLSLSLSLHIHLCINIQIFVITHAIYPYCSSMNPNFIPIPNFHVKRLR